MAVGSARGFVLHPHPGWADKASAALPIVGASSGGETLSIASPDATPPKHRGEPIMLHYAVVFFVIALIAALFGFGGLAAGAASIAKILFVLFAILAVASFLFGLIKR
jgi:uncharacterized membrane protein YtjA (UPF0391 family)